MPLEYGIISGYPMVSTELRKAVIAGHIDASCASRDISAEGRRVVSSDAARRPRVGRICGFGAPQNPGLLPRRQHPRQPHNSLTALTRELHRPYRFFRSFFAARLFPRDGTDGIGVSCCFIHALPPFLPFFATQFICELTVRRPLPLGEIRVAH